MAPATGCSPPEAGQLLTGRRWADLLIGNGLVLGPSLVAGIALFSSYANMVQPILLLVLLGTIMGYFGLRAHYPVVARGIVWGWIFMPLLVFLYLLGLLMVCVSAMK